MTRHCLTLARRGAVIAASGLWSSTTAAAAQLPAPQPAAPQPSVSQPLTPRDSVTIRIANMELRTAVQLLGQYLERPIIFSGQGSSPVTLETPRPVPRGDVVRILRGLLDAQNYELVDDTTSRIYRARPREQAARGAGSALDAQPRAATAVELFVIRLKHARAPDVASTLNALFGKVNANDPSGRRPTLGDELRANQVPPLGTPPPQAIPGAAGRPASLTGEVTIVSDERANSLLIRANRADFQLMSAAVTELDVRPLQVLIEVLIAEVRRDRALTLGVDASLPKTKLRDTDHATIQGTVQGAGTSSAGTGSTTTPGGSPSSTGTSAGLGEFVLKVMGLGTGDVELALRAAASRGNVQIVSRPVIITANNQEAQIVVGSQRPFVQVSRALPTDAAVRDQIVQYKEVGTKLSVTPTISGDGSVQLDVSQEVSNATSEVAFNAPVISTRTVQTQLLVRDGQTVALGGLTDRQRDVSTRGVPFLSSIPLIGGLFGSTARNTSETELFLFLTPHVIRSDEDAARLTDPLRKRAERANP